METLRIIEHGNGHTDIEALIFGDWVVVKCIEEKTSNQEQNMQYTLTAKNSQKTVIEVYFTAFASETARKIYEARGYTVTVEEK